MPPSPDPSAEGRAAGPARTASGRRSSRDEVRGAYRAQSITSIEEADGDVQAFLEEVDAKRRQLDEQIHRYMKQKEREFKLFERDARIRYRTAGSVRPMSPPRVNSMSSSSSLASMVASPSPSGKTTHPNKILEQESAARSRTPQDRESDFLGVFTPSYLPLLNNDRKKQAERAERAAVGPSSSAPNPTAMSSVLSHSGEPQLQRANSDPVDEGKPGKTVRIKLEKRHSSSGSESRLVSALKTHNGHSSGPKRKRVSLVVGDEVVAPSDNIAAYESANELARELSQEDLSKGAAGDGTGDEAATQEEDAADEIASPDSSLECGIPTGHPAERHKSGISFEIAEADGPKSPLLVEQTKSSGEDLFGFDDIITQDEGEGQVEDLNSEDISDVEVSPVSSPIPAEDIRKSALTFKRIDLPERPVSGIRTLSSSSAQPVSPGFSRPSVTSEPLMMFNKDLASPEIEDNMDYGSVTHSFLDRTGSLGESFMERNAQELKKSGRRRLSATAQA